MIDLAEDYWDISQEASGGPILPYGWGVTWRHHLSDALFMLAMVVGMVIITAYNLMVLYHTRPDYGQDLAAQRAFCAEQNERIISSTYYWDEEKSMCRISEAEMAEGWADQDTDWE